MNNRQSNCVTQSVSQSRQWCYVGDKYLRDWRQLRLCWFNWKLAHNPSQNTGPHRTYHITGGNTRYCRGWARQNCTTNSYFIPYWQYHTSRSQRCQDQHTRKPQKQWRHSAGPHPAISVALTPGRRIDVPSRASAAPMCQGQQRRPSITRGRPPIHLPTWRRLHDVWSLPGLGAP